MSPRHNFPILLDFATPKSLDEKVIGASTDPSNATIAFTLSKSNWWVGPEITADNRDAILKACGARHLKSTIDYMEENAPEPGKHSHVSMISIPYLERLAFAFKPIEKRMERVMIMLKKHGSVLYDFVMKNAIANPTALFPAAFVVTTLMRILGRRMRVIPAGCWTVSDVLIVLCLGIQTPLMKSNDRIQFELLFIAVFIVMVRMKRDGDEEYAREIPDFQLDVIESSDEYGTLVLNMGPDGTVAVDTAYFDLDPEYKVRSSMPRTQV